MFKKKDKKEESKKDTHLEEKVSCEVCFGRGLESSEKLCPACNGTGLK